MNTENIEKNVTSMERLRSTNISMRDIISIVFRQKNKMIIFFILAVTFVSIVTILLPEVYQAESKLLIKIGRESLSMDPSVIGPTVSLVQRRETEVNSEISILKSRYVIEKVVDSVGIDKFFKKKSSDNQSRASFSFSLASLVKLIIPSRFSRENYDETMILRDKAIQKVMKGLHVENERDSNILKIQFQAKDPHLAKDVLSSLVDFFLSHHIKVHGSQTSSKFFKHQTDQLFEELNQKETILRTYCSDNGIVSLERQKNILIDQVNRLQNDIDQTAAQIAASQAKISSLEKKLRGSSSIMEISRISGKTNPAADEIKTRLIELRLKETDLSERYPDDYRLLKEIRKQIEIAEEALSKEENRNTEITIGINRNHQILELDLLHEKTLLDEQSARKISLETDLDSAEKSLSNLIVHETFVNNAERDIDILQKKYLDYRDKFEQAKISEALDMDKVSNIGIVQSAMVSFDPIKPNKIINIVLGVMLGIFGGFCLAFIVDYFDDSLKTREDVEKRLNLPVLTAISKEEYRKCI